MVLLLLSFSVSAFAGKYAGWKSYSIPNEIDFEIPPILMLKEDSVVKMQEALKSNTSRKRLELRFVPVATGNTKYHGLVRVRVDIDEDKPVAYKFGDNLNISKSDLMDWEFRYLGALMQDFANRKKDIYVGEILNHMQVFPVDGKDALYFEYVTHHGKEPFYCNYIYRFLNGSRVYHIIMRVRSDELKYWLQNGNDIRNIVRTVMPVR